MYKMSTWSSLLALLLLAARSSLSNAESVSNYKAYVTAATVTPDTCPKLGTNPALCSYSAPSDSETLSVTVCPSKSQKHYSAKPSLTCSGAGVVDELRL